MAEYANTELISFVLPGTHLRDAQPLSVGRRVVKAKGYVRCFVRVEGEPLEIVRQSARLDLAVEIAVVVHVEDAGPDGSSVKCDIHRDNVLRFIEVVLDTTSPVSVDQVTLARPARVPIETVVSSVFGPATVRAAARTRRPFVEPRGFHLDGCPFGRIDENWGRQGRFGRGQSRRGDHYMRRATSIKGGK